MPLIVLTGTEFIYKCKNRANVSVVFQTHIRKGLFYIKKESQSDYIISSQNSRISSYSRPYIVLKEVL